MDNNSVYILDIEAKDLYLANHIEINEKYGQTEIIKNSGYSCVDTKKYRNTLDYSLDLEKLREVYEIKYRNQRFSFAENKKEYTNRAVVVKFDYAYKDFNKVAKGIYIKAGYVYKYIKDFFNECVCCDNDGNLLGIKLNEECEENSQVYLPKYFAYDSSNKCYVLTQSNFKTLKSNAQLREYLYENGFTCNGIKFVRDKRSSGSSRVGKCMFVDEKLYNSLLKWEKCGLSVREGDEIDLAAFESYISLPSSSCINTLEILPENFLVIDDYESEFEDTVVAIEYENKHLVSNEKKATIKNSIFDGESIMDESLFEKYPDRSMLLLRNRFFKSACFKGKVQKWLHDNHITDVSQLNGFTLAKNIEDIKIITTPSSIKYLKFGSLEQWFENLYTTFGIVKYEKSTHYLDGKMVQCHYQLINTLNLSADEVKELVKPSLDYAIRIRTDPDVLRYHIKYPLNAMNEELTSAKSKNEIIFKMLGINDNFCKTKMYYSFRDDLVKSLISNYKQGHILINGNYSTLLGNGIEMLQHAIGKFTGKSVIGVGNIHSKRFPYGIKVLGSRSPHICSGNILLVDNVENDLIDTYFDLSKEVVYVNAINENIQQRLNGADYDSDTMLMTDNQILINAAEKNYDLFKVPTCFVSAKKTKRHYTAKDKCDLDCKTSTNKIGEIVNLSQYLQSIMWNNIHADMKLKANKGKSVQDIIRGHLDLYRDICILAVMSGIEIDKAKKEFELSTPKELDRLKNKYSVYREIKDETKLVKPNFFKLITLNNGYLLNNKHHYEYFHTPMDYLQGEINGFNFRKNRHTDEVLPFSSVIKEYSLGNISNSYYMRKDRIINLIKDLKLEISKLYKNYDNKSKCEKEEIRIIAGEIKQQCINYINDISMPEATMYLILKEIDNNANSGYARLIFNTLFGTPNEKFFIMLDSNKVNMPKIVENQYGTIKLFDYNYIKVCT